jgi:hypothetical protein
MALIGYFSVYFGLAPDGFSGGVQPMGVSEMTALRLRSRFAIGFIACGLALAWIEPAAPAGGGDGQEAVPAADCGPGSRPETGVQGQVPRVDRDSGRSRQGYQCNLELVGQYQGSGAGVVSARYGNCVYMGSFGSSIPTAQRGVQVVDVSDPGEPRHVRTLTSPAMAAGTWETLKVNEARGLLAAVGTTADVGPLLFDVYDVGADCTDPVLLNGVGGRNISAPIGVLGHEGNFSPDGHTYYATSTVGGWVTAIGLDDPGRPKILFSGSAGSGNHGLSISADGNRMYGVTTRPAGVQILDVSDIKARKPFPQMREIGAVTWDDGLITQHTIPITSDGDPYVVAVDEAASGSVRIIDIADETAPHVIQNIRLEINLAENTHQRAEDTGGDGLFGYEAHYCNVDRQTDPTALACGFIQSGVRVFDISDLLAPREIAYFNPPAVGGGFENWMKLPNSPHTGAVLFPQVFDPASITLGGLIDAVEPDMNTDWCVSPPWFAGANRLWVTCSDNGVMALEFSNDAYREP